MCWAKNITTPQGERGMAVKSNIKAGVSVVASASTSVNVTVNVNVQSSASVAVDTGTA